MDSRYAAFFGEVNSLKRFALIVLAFLVFLALPVERPAPVLAQAAPAASQSAPVTPSNTARKSETAPDVALPTADSVIARYVRALGGEAVLKKVTSRVLKGTFEVPSQNVTGEAEVVMAAPDRFYSLVKLSDEVRFIQAFDGKAGWSYDPQRGLRDLAGAELEQMRRSSQFEYELRFRELFPESRVINRVSEGARTAWVLEATPAGAPAEKFYFDTETGLLLRHDSVQAGFEGDVAIVHRYSDYASFDGVQVPTVLKHTDPQVEWQVKFTDVHNNVPVDQSKFTKPAAQ